MSDPLDPHGIHDWWRKPPKEDDMADTQYVSYQQVADALRRDAELALSNYPEALAKLAGRDDAQPQPDDAEILHAPMLILQATGFTIAAGLFAVAQAIHDATEMARPMFTETVMLAPLPPDENS